MLIIVCWLIFISDFICVPAATRNFQNSMKSETSVSENGMIYFVSVYTVKPGLKEIILTCPKNLFMEEIL